MRSIIIFLWVYGLSFFLYTRVVLFVIGDCPLDAGGRFCVTVFGLFWMLFSALTIEFNDIRRKIEEKL